MASIGFGQVGSERGPARGARLLLRPARRRPRPEDTSLQGREQAEEQESPPRPPCPPPSGLTYVPSLSSLPPANRKEPACPVRGLALRHSPCSRCLPPPFPGPRFHLLGEEGAGMPMARPRPRPHGPIARPRPGHENRECAVLPLLSREPGVSALRLGSGAPGNFLVSA